MLSTPTSCGLHTKKRNYHVTIAGATIIAWLAAISYENETRKKMKKNFIAGDDFVSKVSINLLLFHNIQRTMFTTYTTYAR